MTTASDLAAVVRLAALTDDRTRSEQAALERVAARVDREINKQVGSNPHLPKGAVVSLHRSPPCTYPGAHDKDCACRGDGVAWKPVGGWSRLLELVKDGA